MNRVDFSSTGGSGDNSDELATKGSATSMGPNGWHPNPT
jgi:hypothetical protein